MLWLGEEHLRGKRIRSGLAILALMVIASETGFRLRRRSGKQAIKDATKKCDCCLS
jgi:hypothetical protein